MFEKLLLKERKRDKLRLELLVSVSIINVLRIPHQNKWTRKER